VELCIGGALRIAGKVARLKEEDDILARVSSNMPEQYELFVMQENGRMQTHLVLEPAPAEPRPPQKSKRSKTSSAAKIH
jgi:hypothetical protein